MATKLSPTEKQEWCDGLRAAFPRGSHAYTVLRHVSKSGLSRSISVLAIGQTLDRDAPDGIRPSIDDMSWHVARVLGRRIDNRHGGVVCGGAGMDMGFELVYALSGALYGYDERGGYTIKQHWL